MNWLDLDRDDEPYRKIIESVRDEIAEYLPCFDPDTADICYRAKRGLRIKFSDINNLIEVWSQSQDLIHRRDYMISIGVFANYQWTENWQFLLPKPFMVSKIIIPIETLLLWDEPISTRDMVYSWYPDYESGIRIGNFGRLICFHHQIVMEDILMRIRQAGISELIPFTFVDNFVSEADIFAYQSTLVED